ncbi:MAG: hypothetical protein Q9198_000508 [Flavoplaca austrocitrina]
MKRDNVDDRNGIFYRKNLNDNIMDKRIWSVYQRVAHDLSPSRRRAGPATVHPSQMNSQRISTRLEESRQGKTRTPNRSPSTTSGGTFYTSPEYPNTDLDRPSEGAASATATDPSIKHEDDGALHLDEIDADVYHDASLSIKSSAGNDEDEIGDAGSLDEMDVTTLNPENRLFLSKEAIVFDIKDPYWAYTMTKSVVRGDQSTANPERLDIFRPSDYASDNVKISAEGLAYLNEIAQADTTEVTLVTPTAATAERYKLQRSFMENEDFQRENHVEACQKLGIENPLRPQLKSMSRQTKFEFWQPVGLQAIIDFEDGKWLRGAILADSMGLGKTFIAASYILRRHEQRLESNDQDLGKPTLIVCPAILVNQWVRELTEIIPNIEIYIYHGDTRSKNRGHNIRSITRKLTKEHEVFRTRTDRSLTVVITTPGTLNARHGPAQLKKYRVKEKKYSRKKAEDQFDMPDNNWEFSLDGAFVRIIVDEATMFKNPLAASSIALRWLVPDFLLAMTATPNPNSHRDFLGLLALIQNPDMYETQNLLRMKWDVDANPYLFDPDQHHPDVRQLQVTCYAFDRFVLQKYESGAISTAVVGKRTASVWQQCLIMRSYSSRVPFRTGPEIGSRIPPVYSRSLEVSFTKPEQVIYDESFSKNIKKLCRVMSDGRVVWNMRYYRNLVLSTSWLGFNYCSSIMGADQTAQLLEDDDTAYKLLEKCHKERPELWKKKPKKDDPAALLEGLCQGSPKLRTFLDIVAEVSIRDKKKIVVWCTFPAEQVYLVKALRLCGLDAKALNRALTHQEREEIIEDFQHKQSSTVCLVCSFFLGAFGLNFQYLSWWCFFWNPAPSIPIGDQCIGRQHRMGQRYVVILNELFVINSFNSKIRANNVAKRLPGVMTELNNRLIKGSDGDDQNESDGVVLGKWVICGELLTPLEDLPGWAVAGEDYIEIDAQDFALQLLDEMGGERIICEDPNVVSWNSQNEPKDDNADEMEIGETSNSTAPESPGTPGERIGNSWPGLSPTMAAIYDS